MKIFQKPDPRADVAVVPDLRALKRAAKLPTAELFAQTEGVIMGMGRAWDAFRYHDGELEEVLLCQSALAALFAELRARSSTS